MKENRERIMNSPAFKKDMMGRKYAVKIFIPIAILAVILCHYADEYLGRNAAWIVGGIGMIGGNIFARIKGAQIAERKFEGD